MIIKHNSGNIANTRVEDFNNHTINEMIQHVVHLNEETCRKVVSKACGSELLSKRFIRADEMASYLNIPKAKVYRAMLNENGGDIIRRHMVVVSPKISFHTPRSIVLFCVINRRYSNACRDISNEAFKACRFRPETVSEKVVVSAVSHERKKKSTVLPTPIEAKVQAPTEIPVQAHLMEPIPQVPEPNEVSVIIRGGTVLKVAAI